MANDNDFLNQKIIPAEENLGDHNNEHKQIVLYCPQGWYKQKGCPRVSVTQTRSEPENEQLSLPFYFIPEQRCISLCSGKVSGTGGCKEGLIHGQCIHLLVVAVPQHCPHSELTQEGIKTKREYAHTLGSS